MNSQPCNWMIYNRYWEYELYQTQCGEEFVMTYGTIEEHDIRFCPVCGGAIKVIEVEEGDYE